MLEAGSLDETSSAVQLHLNLLQNVIQRMAENSRYCKIWCVTLISATLFFIARTEQPQSVFIAVFPTLAFWLLDAYYLALERGFRESYKEFVAKIHGNELTLSAIYKIHTTGSRFKLFMCSLTSMSILLCYPVITGVIFLAFIILQSADSGNMCNCPTTGPAAR